MYKVQECSILLPSLSSTPLAGTQVCLQNIEQFKTVVFNISWILYYDHWILYCDYGFYSIYSILVYYCTLNMYHLSPGRERSGGRVALLRGRRYEAVKEEEKVAALFPVFASDHNTQKTVSILTVKKTNLLIYCK